MEGKMKEVDAEILRGNLGGVPLLGRPREMGVHLDTMVSQWMQGPPPVAQAQLEAAGIRLPWGTDYALVKGTDFCAAAWGKHR